MPSCIIERIDAQLEDLKQLRDRYDLTVSTPKVEERMRSGYATSKELEAKINCLNIHIKWPRDYPDSSPVEVEVIDTSGDGNFFNLVNRNISTFASACVGSTKGYALDVIRYAADLLDEMQSGSAVSDEITTISLHVLKYNHLLKGPEHKKEREMVSSGKGFHGAIYYGTPGLVVLCGGESECNEYLQTCRSIGKRGDLVYSKETPSEDEGVQILLAANGLCELPVEGIQDLVGGIDTFKREILGIV